MVSYKSKISEQIAKATNIPQEEIEKYIEIPKDMANGDYAFPCFKLAKTLKKSPIVIANEIKQEFQIEEDIISKVEVVGGYLNFFVNKLNKTKQIIEEMANNEQYGKSNFGKGTNIIVEFSSPNIAKPFHIGHLRTTGIGQALYNIYKFLCPLL